MDCLNGRRRATGGKVLANGEDFYRLFDNFRQSLGYVPQKDIVHTQLTVYRALYYTAQLRLPIDTDPAELKARIETVLREMELQPHRDTLVGNLSGGQIKRVSLGAELIAEPCLLYIDEATSGLDAGTEARMMRLFRRLADEGRSIICITHNVDNVDQCHLALILARGKLIYYGPPGEAPRYFGVTRITEIYDRIGQKDLAEWEKEFQASSLYQEYIAGRIAETHPETPPIRPAPALPSAPGVINPGAGDATVAASGAAAALVHSAPSSSPPLADRFRDLTGRALRWRNWLTPVKDSWHQFRVLTARYIELIAGDSRGLRLLLLQAPIVAVFLLIGFLQDFRGEVPITRLMHPEERRLLGILAKLDDLVNSPGGELTDDQRDALKKVTLEIPRRGTTQTITGLELVAILQGIQALAPDARKRLELDKVRFTYKEGDKVVSLTLNDISEGLRQVHDSGVLDKLKDIEGPLVPVKNVVNPRYTYMLLFILVMIVLWFGCNNAAKEIVKEEAIYGRERAVNLGILPYLASKFLVQSVITIIHALTLMAILYGALYLLHLYDPAHHTMPWDAYMLSYEQQIGVLALLSMTGVALGLLLSACVATPDRANALLPYVLIPQMILGGGFLSVNKGVLHYLATTLSPVYWAYRAMHLKAGTFPEWFPAHATYEDDIWLPCEALGIQMVLLLLLAAWFLKRKEA
jgi:ABC-type multidrug transport system ATPase subunit